MQIKEKELNMIAKIKKLDKQLFDYNFDVNVALKTISIGVTSDKDDPLHPS
jgi:hypothetical protein